MGTELHISTIGQLFSFRPKGGAMDQRSAIFSALRYGDGPDAVLVTYGIQGEGYFAGLVEHGARITEGVRCIMGYVWPAHTKVYRRKLRGLASVEVLFSGHPYGLGGPIMDWVVVTPSRLQ